MKNRAQRSIIFLVVWLTMFSCFCGWGQNPYPAGLKRDFALVRYPGDERVKEGPNTLYKGIKEAAESPGKAWFSYFSFSNGGKRQVNALYTQPADLYYIQSGFFCKREWEFEKTTHIPFRFRLGSLADCNALEGKH